MATRSPTPATVLATVGLGLAAGLGVGLVVHGVETISRRAKQARAIRRAADRELYAGLVQLSRDRWADPRIRSLAALAADGFKTMWLDAGHSGRALPASERLALYGNWCGPGHGGGPCIDRLDCLCRNHDLAYEDAATVSRGHAAVECRPGTEGTASNQAAVEGSARGGRQTVRTESH